MNKKAPECTFCEDRLTGMDCDPCFTCDNASNFCQIPDVMYDDNEAIGQEKPQSLLAKYFKMWRKMTILIYKIFILSRKCAKYPDLKKYRGHPKVKDIVKAWRLKLKGFESKLKELI